MSRSPLARVAAATGLTVTTLSAGLLLAPSALAAPTELPAPTVSAGVPGQTFTISGTGCTSPEPNPALRVDAGVGYGQMGDGGHVKPDADGSWTITLTVPDGLPAGSYPVTAWCTLYQGQEIDYAAATMTVAGPAATPTTGAPATSTPAPAAFTPGAVPNTPGIALKTNSATTAAPGQKVVKVLKGFQPFERVTVVMHSTPVTLGTFTADAQGVVTVEYTVPAGAPQGTHTLAYDGDKGSHFEETVTVGTPALATAGDDELAYTGADVTVPLVAGAGLIALGGATVFATRRRKAAARI